MPARRWLVVPLLGWATIAAIIEQLGASQSAPPEADALIVLGCAPEPDGAASPCLTRRAEVAARRWQEGGLSAVAVCGGAGSGTTEAAVLAGLLQERGVPAAVIVQEDASTSTWENATLLHLSADRVILATDAAHLPRAMAVFRRFRAEVHGLPAEATWGARAWLALREVPAWAFYLLSGRVGPLADDGA